MTLNLTEKTLEREGCTLHYWCGGDPDGVPLVFSHGAYIDHREWENELALTAAAGYRVLGWDIRGHGQSRPGDFTMPAAVADLIALLDREGIQKAVFIGHSMGGNLHQEAIFHHPERFLALVTEDSTWNFQKLTRAEEWGIKLGVPLIGCYPYQTLIRQMAAVSAAGEASQAYLREAMSQLRKEEFVQVMREATLCLHEEPTYTLPVPNLLIVGERDTTGNIRKVAPQWAKREPLCTYVVIPAAMHCAHMDQPEAFHKLLLEFLAKVTG
jgi:pimeloyl-ACP methyl ester carboxylesterase